MTEEKDPLDGRMRGESSMGVAGEGALDSSTLPIVPDTKAEIEKARDEFRKNKLLLHAQQYDAILASYDARVAELQKAKAKSDRHKVPPKRLQRLVREQLEREGGNLKEARYRVLSQLKDQQVILSYSAIARHTTRKQLF